MLGRPKPALSTEGCHLMLSYEYDNKTRETLCILISDQQAEHWWVENESWSQKEGEKYLK